MKRWSSKKKIAAAGLEQLGNKMKSIDIFGEDVTFNIARSSTHKTYLGSFLTLVFLVITATYAIKRYNILSNFGDTVYLTSSEVS